jgi:hypothetical protein
MLLLFVDFPFVNFGKEVGSEVQNEHAAKNKCLLYHSSDNCSEENKHSKLQFLVPSLGQSLINLMDVNR